jgi:membrane protease subunit (stomatin/prohibitin family)
MVRLRAFGTYEIRITDPKQFMNEIVGTDHHFTVDEIEGQLTNLIISKFTTILGGSKVPVLDLASNYEKFSEFILENIAPYFEEYGLHLNKILVENISLPSNVEEALDKRSSREITGNLDEYIKYQTGEALGSEGGGAMSDMVGMGAGIALGQTMAESLSKKNSIDKHTPPPIPERNSTMYYVAFNDAKEGPYDLRTIQLYINENKIQKDTLIWTEGLKDWAEASSILEKYFQGTPPPLPSNK